MGLHIPRCIILAEKQYYCFKWRIRGRSPSSPSFCLLNNNINYPVLSANIPSLDHRNAVAALCVFYRYFHHIYSDGLTSIIVPLVASLDKQKVQTIEIASSSVWVSTELLVQPLLMCTADGYCNSSNLRSKKRSFKPSHLKHYVFMLLQYNFTCIFRTSTTYI